MRGLKKFLVIGALAPILLLVFLVTGLFFMTGDMEGDSEVKNMGYNLSENVLSYKPLVEKYCNRYGIRDYVYYILAIMQVESGGNGDDVMQSSESLGLAPNSLSPEESIKQGCYYFSRLLESAKQIGCDINTVVHAYNYGGGFIGYVAENGRSYSFKLAESFAKERSGGEKVNYSHSIAVAHNGGWRYRYGNMFYVRLVGEYLVPTRFDDDMVKAVMAEALKYEGWRYVFGGASPSTSFDCSGLTMWCYDKVGIKLPHSAQLQYERTQHIPLSEAEPGDLVFFHSTYNTANYITHVGIYVGNGKMYHAGDPIGYTDLNYSYWQEHLVGAGRVISR